MEAEQEVHGEGYGGHLDILAWNGGGLTHGDNRPQDWARHRYGLAPGRRVSLPMGR